MHTLVTFEDRQGRDFNYYDNDCLAYDECNDLVEDNSPDNVFDDNANLPCDMAHPQDLQTAYSDYERQGAKLFAHFNFLKFTTTAARKNVFSQQVRLDTAN